MKKRAILLKKDILLIVLLLILIASLYLLFTLILDLIAEPLYFIEQETQPDRNQSSFSSKLQFFPDMRFPKRDISYNIDSSCSEDKKERMENAFSVLEEETSLLNFYPSSENTDIAVNCSEEEQIIQEDFFIAGEGGPTSIINTTLFYIIQGGKVLLIYEKSSCDNNNIELHELLHVLGFIHSENKESIMYPTIFCNQVLTLDIVRELKRLYSIQELPDLYFSNISSLKKGRYLDFEVEIRNKGLSTAENSSLDLYAEDRKIDNFDIGDIDYGGGKILSAKNIKIGRNAKKIKFIILSKKELDKSNNVISLVLAS